MKRRVTLYEMARLALFAAVLAVMSPVAAAPADKPAAAQPAVAEPATPPPPPRSVFNMPSSPKEGRDPFFPTSTRPYEVISAATNHGGDLSGLSIKGFSGTANRRFVIINNHTFGVGDEEDITTSQGRIHVHCLEINGGTVLIEANGERRELTYGGAP
jgi:hypothetical protein